MIKQISIISGLDPARPAFESVGPKKRISTSDAKLVEIIHTNDRYYGLPDAVGHLDFYPNGGGKSQPGCHDDYDCAHDRAYVFYAEAIVNPDAFVGVRCKNYAEFLKGACENATATFSSNDRESQPQGTFYLRTSSGAPYGLGLAGTKPGGV